MAKKVTKKTAKKSERIEFSMTLQTAGYLQAALEKAMSNEGDDEFYQEYNMLWERLSRKLGELA